jgi:hypothetical protein
MNAWHHLRDGGWPVGLCVWCFRGENIRNGLKFLSFETPFVLQGDD